MKKIILLSFFFFGLTIAHGQNENFYAPWHLKDTGQISVSKLGHYVSFGLGGGRSKSDHEGAVSELASYSFAYKSHLFSLTYMHAGTLIGGEDEPFLYTHYYGFLFGESIRNKNLLFSLSTGIARSYVDVRYPNPNHPTSPRDIFAYCYSEGFSCPVELKLFLVANKGIGIGIHASKNIVIGDECSPFIWGVSLMFGKWNKSSR